MNDVKTLSSQEKEYLRKAIKDAAIRQAEAIALLVDKMDELNEKYWESEDEEERKKIKSVMDRIDGKIAEMYEAFPRIFRAMLSKDEWETMELEANDTLEPIFGESAPFILYARSPDWNIYIVLADPNPDEDDIYYQITEVCLQKMWE